MNIEFAVPGASTVKYGDRRIGLTQEGAERMLSAMGEAPQAAFDTLTALGFVMPPIQCGANLAGPMLQCNSDGGAPMNCGCTPTVDERFGWDGCVWAPSAEIQDNADRTCEAFQHRIYPFVASVAMRKTRRCEASEAIWVYKKEENAARCKYKRSGATHSGGLSCGSDWYQHGECTKKRRLAEVTWYQACPEGALKYEEDPGKYVEFSAVFAGTEEGVAWTGPEIRLKGVVSKGSTKTGHEATKDFEVSSKAKDNSARHTLMGCSDGNPIQDPAPLPGQEGRWTTPPYGGKLNKSGDDIFKVIKNEDFSAISTDCAKGDEFKAKYNREPKVKGDSQLPAQTQERGDRYYDIYFMPEECKMLETGSLVGCDMPQGIYYITMKYKDLKPPLKAKDSSFPSSVFGVNTPKANKYPPSDVEDDNRSCGSFYNKKCTNVDSNGQNVCHSAVKNSSHNHYFNKIIKDKEPVTEERLYISSFVVEQKRIDGTTVKYNLLDNFGGTKGVYWPAPGETGIGVAGTSAGARESQHTGTAPFHITSRYDEGEFDHAVTVYGDRYPDETPAKEGILVLTGTGAKKDHTVPIGMSKIMTATGSTPNPDYPGGNVSVTIDRSESWVPVPIRSLACLKQEDAWTPAGSLDLTPENCNVLPDYMAGLVDLNIYKPNTPGAQGGHTAGGFTDALEKAVNQLIDKRTPSTVSVMVVALTPHLFECSIIVNPASNNISANDYIEERMVELLSQQGGGASSYTQEQIDAMLEDMEGGSSIRTIPATTVPNGVAVVPPPAGYTPNPTLAVYPDPTRSWTPSYVWPWEANSNNLGGATRFDATSGRLKRFVCPTSSNAIDDHYAANVQSIERLKAADPSAVVLALSLGCDKKSMETIGTISSYGGTFDKQFDPAGGLYGGCNGEGLVMNEATGQYELASDATLNAVYELDIDTEGSLIFTEAVAQAAGPIAVLNNGDWIASLAWAIARPMIGQEICANQPEGYCDDAQ